MTAVEAMSTGVVGGVLEMEPAVEIKKLNKWYGKLHVLKDVDLTVGTGEQIVICGPSGSGKSTLIRCVNQLEEHQQGEIRVNGREVGPGVRAMHEIRRNVGMVFQHFNLFPHLTVLRNCTLALTRAKRLPRGEAEDIARHYLARVKIPEKADAIQASSQAGNASAWPSHALYACIHGSCCSMSRLPLSTPR